MKKFNKLPKLFPNKVDPSKVCVQFSQHIKHKKLWKLPGTLPILIETNRKTHEIQYFYYSVSESYNLADKKIHPEIYSLSPT